MDIVVITGQVPATDVAIEYDRWLNGVDPNDILYTASRYDLQVVEEAIRIRDSQGKGMVTLVGIGPPRVEAALRMYLSMGADAAVHICDRSLENSDAYGLSLALSRAIKDMKYNLILCGAESVDGSGCAVFIGSYIAEILGLPHVSGVTKIELQTGELGLVVHRKIEKGDRQVIRCPLPCLLAVELGINEPRYPTFPDSLASLRKDIRVLDIVSLGLKSTEIGLVSCFTKVVRASPPRGRVKRGLVINTSLTPAERMKLVMSGGLSTKSKQTLLTGESNKLAEEIVSILVGQGIIRELLTRR